MKRKKDFNRQKQKESFERRKEKFYIPQQSWFLLHFSQLFKVSMPHEQEFVSFYLKEGEAIEYLF